MVVLFRAIKNDNRIKNDVLFYQGGCKSGYILKHHRFISPTRIIIEPDHPINFLLIKINLLSINQIPPVKEFTNESKFVINVSLKGDKCDEKNFEKSFQSDGFRYLFENDGWELEFKIFYPLEAIFMVSIQHEDSIICKAAFPTISIRKGYRIIPLCDNNNKIYAFSNILGEFQTT